MIRVSIITEGPDDVAALTEILFRFFNARTAKSASPIVRERQQTLRLFEADKVTPLGELTITALANDGAIDDLLVAKIRAQPSDGADKERFALVYDPDERSVSDCEARFDGRIRALEASGWTVERSNSVWKLVRAEPPTETSVRAIAWQGRCDTPPCLPDRQNLERLLCTINESTWPQGKTTVTRWLTEIDAQRAVLGVAGKPTWKTAIHLWCALVDDKASEAAVVKRFLGQNEAARTSVKQALLDAGILTALEALVR